jgi:hypothetical protein
MASDKVAEIPRPASMDCGGKRSATPLSLPVKSAWCNPCVTSTQSGVALRLPPQSKPTARALTCAASVASNAPAPSASLLAPSCPGPPPLTPTAHEPPAGQTNQSPAQTAAPFQCRHGHAQPLPQPAAGASGDPRPPYSGAAPATGPSSNPDRVPPKSSFPLRAIAPPPLTSPLTNTSGPTQRLRPTHEVSSAPGFHPARSHTLQPGALPTSHLC